MITLRMPAADAEHVCFELSPLAELMRSWHVLAVPEHHALQLPWVRRCRELPASLRAGLREWSWLVRDEPPTLFEAGADGLVSRFAEELDRVAALPADRVAEELTRAVELADDPDGERLHRVKDDPVAVLNEVLGLVERYWRAGFAEEWRALEPRMLDAVADAGSAMTAGVLPALDTLVPAVTVNERARTLRLSRPHDHRVDLAVRGPLRLTPSFFAWPHVRITCDEPWPPRLTYPVVPPSRGARRTEPAMVLARLRALAAQPRLDILRLLREQPRSTQELSRILGMSGAAVSGHLRKLLGADLVHAHRDGYYVLYQVAPQAIDDLATQLVALG
jgi:DNA-binding transcriptional ArsR family regulator